MDNKLNWRSSSKNHQQSIFIEKSLSEHPYGRFMLQSTDTNEATRSSSSSSSSTSGLSKMERLWKKLRRKLRKEKRFFDSNPVIVPYNPYSYAKNFEDHALNMAEPDNFSRSFSSRFATSSSSMFSRVQSVR